MFAMSKNNNVNMKSSEKNMLRGSTNKLYDNNQNYSTKNIQNHPGGGEDSNIMGSKFENTIAKGMLQSRQGPIKRGNQEMPNRNQLTMKKGASLDNVLGNKKIANQMINVASDKIREMLDAKREKAQKN